MLHLQILGVYYPEFYSSSTIRGACYSLASEWWPGGFRHANAPLIALPH